MVAVSVQFSGAIRNDSDFIPVSLQFIQFLSILGFFRGRLGLFLVRRVGYLMSSIRFFGQFRGSKA